MDPSPLMGSMGVNHPNNGHHPQFASPNDDWPLTDTSLHAPNAAPPDMVMPAAGNLPPIDLNLNSHADDLEGVFRRSFPDLALIKRSEEQQQWTVYPRKGPKIGALAAFQALISVDSVNNDSDTNNGTSAKSAAVKLKLFSFDGRKVHSEEVDDLNDCGLLSDLNRGKIDLCSGISGDPDDLIRQHPADQLIVHFSGDRLLARHRDCAVVLRNCNDEVAKCGLCKGLDLDDPADGDLEYTVAAAEDDDAITTTEEHFRNGKLKTEIKQENSDEEENQGQICPNCKRRCNSLQALSQHILRCVGQPGMDLIEDDYEDEDYDPMTDLVPGGDGGDPEEDDDEDVDEDDDEEEDDYEPQYVGHGWKPNKQAKRNNESKRHRCDKCGKKYSSALPYRKHRRRCHNRRVGGDAAAAKQEPRAGSSSGFSNSQSGPRQCFICLRELNHMFGRHFAQHEEHLDLHTVVQCPRCEVRVRKMDINQHFGAEHLLKAAAAAVKGEVEDNAHQTHGVCVVCFDVLDSNELHKHLSKHVAEIKSHLCPTCGESFHLARELRNHVANKHEPPKPPVWVVCDQCGKQFSSRKKLVAHIRQCHDKSKAFPCHLCDKVFYMRGKLNQHLTIHSQEKPFRCAYCGYRSVRRDNVLLHVRKVHKKDSSKDDVITEGKYMVEGANLDHLSHGRWGFKYAAEAQAAVEQQQRLNQQLDDLPDEQQHLLQLSEEQQQQQQEHPHQQ